MNNMIFVKKYIKKNNLINLLIFLISELICFGITSFNLLKHDSCQIYISGIFIVQFFYFIPVLLASFYFGLSQKTQKKLLIYTTFFLIFDSIILHFFTKQLAMLLTSSRGVLNFVKYSAKIYFIALPLIGFQTFFVKKVAMKKSHFLVLFRIIGLFFITFIFKFCFGLKGILYSWPLSEFIWTLLFFIKNKNCRLI